MSKNLNAHYRGGIAIASIGVAGGAMRTMKVFSTPNSNALVEAFRAELHADGLMPLFEVGPDLVKAAVTQDTMGVLKWGNVLLNEFGVDYLGLIERDGRIVGCAPCQGLEGQEKFEAWANKEFTNVVDEVVRSLKAGEKHVNIANMENALGMQAHPTTPIRPMTPGEVFKGPLPGLGGAPWRVN